MKVKCDKEGIEQASKIIRDGGIVVFPTDTVYGIGCDPYNKKSVDKIYQIKRRSKTKPFPVLAFSIDEATKIVEFDKVSRKIANKFWQADPYVEENCLGTTNAGNNNWGHYIGSVYGNGGRWNCCFVCIDCRPVHYT